MNILVDTQIMVWSLDIDSPLSKRQKEILQDTGNRIIASYISLMELVIKKSIGKLAGFCARYKSSGCNMGEKWL